MTLIIIAVSIVFFGIYLACFRYFGVDARIEMLFLHIFTLIYELLLAGLLIFLLLGDYPSSTTTATIACLSGVDTVLAKYTIAEMVKARG